MGEVVGMISPTQRSLKYLREQGWRVAVVEYWHAFARKRMDLFHAFDLLCVRGEETLAVQVTSASNVSARVNKIAENEAVPDLRKAGWSLFVHGWRKGKDGKWIVREVDVS